ncbi:MAG: DUF4252 domain-containing protein [Bacteroidales bacterium]|nr:DUF4252 domain-containing protein [Bacteroidales bacterium]MCF8403053.1 DUF4252 domain-containing protein [Bacteroidales bacterium]
MKSLILRIAVAALAVLPMLSFSQSKSVAGIFDKYSGVDGFTSVEITKGLFELFAQVEADDPEFEDFKKAIEGLESMRLLAFSLDEGKGDSKTRENFISEIKKTVPLNEFQELMVVKDKDANINFYAKSNKQVINEMIMIVDGANEAVFLSLYGNIDLNYVAKLGSAMDMGGMEYLGKMKHE